MKFQAIDWAFLAITAVLVTATLVMDALTRRERRKLKELCIHDWWAKDFYYEDGQERATSFKRHCKRCRRTDLIKVIAWGEPGQDGIYRVIALDSADGLVKVIPYISMNQ